MSEPTVIKPTVGRVVIFRPAKDFYDFGYCIGKGREHAAIVACVHGDRCVNLTISDLNGKTFNRTSVTLVQPGDTPPNGGDYCEWMPYQVGVAKAQQQCGEPLKQPSGPATAAA